MTGRGFRMMIIASVLAAVFAAGDAHANICVGKQTITANVVVLDNPTVFNRLGAQNPNWITYALRRDVVFQNRLVPDDPDNGTPITMLDREDLAGNVALRPDKRTRPLVVRSVAGACLTVNFQNLLTGPGQGQGHPQGANPNPPQQDLLFNDDQVRGRCASFHATGVELVNVANETGTPIGNDGSFVGINHAGDDVENNCGFNQRKGSLVGPNGMITYKLYTPHEGAYVVNSYGATLGSEQNGGNLGMGMFAVLNVQPKRARIYRSQVTEEEMRLATTGTTALGQPIINYEATYPMNEPWISEGKAGLPILNMLTAAGELVHSDINAIIVGTGTNGTFLPDTYPLESVGKNNPQLPNRLEPFREFTSVFHDEQTNSQAFPRWYEHPVLEYTLTGVRDAFMINYGSGGIGSEIIANRLRTGPMHDCTDCAYEEFFLSSLTVGDPAGLVHFPANSGIEQCDPTNIAGPSCWRDPANLANGPIEGNFALFQEDPANVHHSYTGDFTKIRNTHVGAFEQHIFHLHNHQWLHNPNDDNANYLDAQEIMPGSGHTYELVNGGVGNRNKTAGDAIFHCHFYPHFAQGMWYHIRIHDVFEKGTVLEVSNADDPQNPTTGFHDVPFALRSGKPMAGARALPDGELPDGFPIPAVVPLPGKPMPHMPATVSIVAVDRGSHSLLGGRGGPDGKPDSAQAVVKRFCGVSEPGCTDAVAGTDGTIGTPDDRNPGYPFWLAGNECGVPTATDPCPAGIVGQRATTPPLDMLTEAGATANGYAAAQAGGWDGGLPRHALLGYVSGSHSADTQNRLDFRKSIKMAQPVYYPETGTDLEKGAMAYHAVRKRLSAKQNLDAPGGGVITGPGVNFVLNGAPAVPGGPYNDPCIDDDGTPLTAGVTGDWFDGDGTNDPDIPATLNTKGRSNWTSENPRTFKIAAIQVDAIFNKVGYHYPQERILTLWEDVQPTIDKIRPPEPLVMRFNTFDCGKILHANLVPKEFELDDFQVRTPTDVIGQHIHLPKWDLTSNDGAGNGWNYEDGTLSPGYVQERIEAINKFNMKVADCVADPAKCVIAAGTLAGQFGPIDLTGLTAVPTIDTGDPGSTVVAGQTVLEAQPHPTFGVGQEIPSSSGPIREYKGARTTIQRILVDPVVNVAGFDRGLGLTFTHDHYGPSTFQQIGLYATILAEPAGSTWRHNESGVVMGRPDGIHVRPDGGPTSWQAAIVTPNSPVPGSTVLSHTIPDHREFYFEMSDFQHAYQAGTYVGAGPDGRPILTEIVQPNPFDVTVASAPAIQDAWQQTVNPPLKVEAGGGFPDVVHALGACPGPAGNFDTGVPRPCAEAINISHSSIWVVNYRNEPVGLRVFDQEAIGPDGQDGTQAAGMAGDLAFALQSRTDRAIAELNTPIGGTPPPIGDPLGIDPPYPGSPPYCQGDPLVAGDFINCDRRPGDPFTPIMRAFERDEVKIKIQVGATEEQHQATVHGVKWLSNGSAFGKSGNSGWRNFQSHGISEQFSLQIPFNPDLNQAGNTVDYLYATDATRDGFWLGTWGILRSYGQNRQDLFRLPDNPANAQILNRQNFAGVCPVELDRRGRPTNVIANLRQYDVTAVLANDVLPNALGVTINANPQVVIGGVVVGGNSDGVGTGDNVGGPLNPAGGTLVYNRRGTVVPPDPDHDLQGGEGPLNDPTAILYVRTNELVFDMSCAHPIFGTDTCRTALGDPVGLQPNVPVEPLVLRANAGDCVEVTLRNALPFTPVEVFGPGPDGILGTPDDVLVGFDKQIDPMPDLAGWQDMMWGVTRRIQNAGAGVNAEMFFFNNNLIRPSNWVGLHPQLVEYDASRDDGVLVGQNSQGLALASPGGQKTSRWYAGHLRLDRVQGGNPNQARFNVVATPVEFGGVNLLSADRVKQPQKGLFGALSIEPRESNWPDALGALDSVPDGQGSGMVTRKTRAQATVNAPPGSAGSGGTYREALLIGHKITNLRWADGSAIRNQHQGELGREGAEDSGHAGFNYGMEPSWFRFRLPPDAEFGNAGAAGSFGALPNVHAFYANGLVAGDLNTIPAIADVSAAGDPVTPVFRMTANQMGRIHVLNGASADRDGTFILHGHLWQRDPFVCPGQSELGLEGRCNSGGTQDAPGPIEPVPSRALGLNKQGKYMGGEEGMGHAYGHWPILFSAGGTDGVPGDYLYRDYAPNGNRNGQFGIMRVAPAPEAGSSSSSNPRGPKKNR